MTTEFPRVDILIPTIGRPSLAQAMLSALAQTYPNVRVVVAADANHSRALSLFHRVDALRHTVGRATARFVTMPAPFGRGDRVKEWWIANADAAPLMHFLDDDDWLPPTAIYDQMTPMIAHHSVVLVVPSTLQILGDGVRSTDYRLRTARMIRGQVVANAALFRTAAAQGVKLESDPANPRFWLHEIADRGRVYKLRQPLYWYNATHPNKPSPLEGKG